MQSSLTLSSSVENVAVGDPHNHLPRDDESRHREETTRVLIADPDPTVRKMLRHVFDRLEWNAIEAKDGEAAIERASQRPAPHAILLDLKLSKIDGYEVCKQLKNNIQTQLIPIVALTTVESTEEKLRAVELGVDEFISKPINQAELHVRLRSLMRIHRLNQELIGAESVAMGLARTVASKDGYSNSHIERVANWAVTFGESLGLDAAELKIIKYGAILHNVGKISIPDQVLENTSALSPREKALFQQHPRVGYEICSPLKPLQPVLPIIRHHKEHWDGTGYPDGLCGNDIPLGAQIVGIVDVYSALTSDRPYRRAIPSEQAIESLRQRADEGWHSPQLVDVFIQCVEEHGHKPSRPDNTSVLETATTNSADSE